MAWMVLKWSIFNIANMSSIVLRWSTAKNMFSDPDLGPKWPPSADIILI